MKEESQLEWILGKAVSLDEFWQEYYTVKPLLIREGHTRFAALFGWDALNRHLNGVVAPHPSMKLIHNARSLVAQDFNDVLDACQDGATLSLTRLHETDAAVSKLATALQKELGEAIQANLYLSQADEQGFKAHYDPHDVFVLQLEGKKRWCIYENPERDVLFRQKHHATSQPREIFLETTICPGDALYVPRGWWHEATSVDGMSMHITVGILARTGIDFLSWAVNELREDAFCRRSFPLVAARNDEIFSQHVEKLVDRLSDFVRDGAMEKYGEYRSANTRKPQPFNFPKQLEKQPVTDGKVVNFTRDRNLVPHVGEAKNGQFQLTIHDRVLTLTERCRQLIENIFARDKFDLGFALSGRGELSEEEAKAVLDALVRASIIDAKREEHVIAK